NMESFLYRNEANKLLPNNNYLKVELRGKDKNPFAIGANVSLKAAGQSFYIENIPIRGFQSSVDYRPNFGLGDITNIDSLIVEWPTGEKSIRTNIKSNQQLLIEYEKEEKSAAEPEGLIKSSKPIFTEILDSLDWRYEHKENLFVDFKRDLLLYHMMSTEGPKIAVADVNGDGKEDFYIGGAANSPAALYVQQADGAFLSTNQSLFQKDRAAEDMDCLFFDADQDGDQDLYVARGGNEFLLNSNNLVDQLYLNDGQGNFSRSPQFLPTFKLESSACVAAADYDKDGDQDLFVGIRAIPGHYGSPVNGYILNNNGKGIFQNASKVIAPELENLGLIKDVIWMDFDGDEDEDLIVAGEWMPISFFENKRGKFQQIDGIPNAEKTAGWWNCMQAGDFDKDGDLDLIVGNHGLNSRFSASADQPISIHIKDFDQNGTPDPIISQYNGGASYPMVLRHDLAMQLPGLKRKYLKYVNYKEQGIEDIFSPEQLAGTLVKEVHNLRSSILINNGDGSFELKDLPIEAQYAPVYGILVEDFDKDGNLDVLLGGNLYGVKPEVGRYDANYGLMLKGKGDASFEVLKSAQSGFFLKGQVRDIVGIKNKDRSLLLVAKNDEPMQVFEY
ncbi:MAG: FG-GAP-like repeat-containing protein, partial [Bacteroidota bacterium]